jgi:hypothetical protein
MHAISGGFLKLIPTDSQNISGISMFRTPKRELTRYAKVGGNFVCSRFMVDQTAPDCLQQLVVNAGVKIR